MRIPRITPAVARKLGHYVYLYVNPTDESIFYVGKGKGGRALAHLRADERQGVMKTIREIQAGGQEPGIEILAHGLRTEEAALRVESAAIDIIGLQNLANSVRGHGAKYGRLPLAEVVARYTRKKANIRTGARAPGDEPKQLEFSCCFGDRLMRDATGIKFGKKSWLRLFDADWV